MSTNANGELILVVEDDDSVLEIIKFSLELAGYRVMAVNDGASALEKATDVTPDLILLDLMIPVYDGYEVCRRLKDGFLTSQIPIVILTAKRDMKDKVTGMEAGADDYITKPFNRTELLARVRMVLLRTAQHRESNPLTGLPGSVTIERRASEFLAEGKIFAVMVIDVDNFKAYNDNYGYSQGDVAIQLLAEVLTDVAAEYGEGVFVGHIGGDDFVVLTTAEQPKELGEKIIEVFETKSEMLFNAEDLARGYFISKARTGEEKRYPCVFTVTIAVVVNTDARYSNYLQMVDVATELKKYGKTVEGSKVVVDRRERNGLNADG
ncbi:MAG: response regulator [Candidatus Coatesbacteria bacterium]|nr:MAG: response regulator [Candidatus Coatesbacteria bacterium]